MKGAVLREFGGPLAIEELKVSKPGPREVLIRTVASGLCHSDLHVIEGKQRGRLPLVLGHEAAGVVESVGEDVRGVQVGDHVITCVSAHCGHCEPCLTGRMALCSSKPGARAKTEPSRLTCAEDETPVNQFFGLAGFAQYMLVHESTCVAIRKDMPLDRAALLGCAVTTGVGAVIHSARVEPGSTVVVVGCGGVGLCAINGAALAGAGRIIAIDLAAAKLELASGMGATDLVDASQCDPVEAVRELTRGGAHYSFEVIGKKETIESAFQMLRPGGLATMIGLPPEGTKVELDCGALLGERRLQGSLMGSNRFPIDMPRYVDLYLQGRLRLDALISQRISLDQINAGFEDLRSGRVARSVIHFGE